MRVSIVIPIRNEEPNVEPLAKELQALAAATEGMEVLFVDDGSDDGTWEKLVGATQRHPNFRALRLPGPMGQSAALWHGLHAARGEMLATMDGDMQNSPEDIPRLLRALDAADVACGYRSPRRDVAARRLAGRVANAVRRCVLGDGIRDAGCGLKAFRRECLADLPLWNGMHRFMPVYFRWNGRRIVEVATAHRPRGGGASHYSICSRLLRGVFDLIGMAWQRRRFQRSVIPTEDICGGGAGRKGDFAGR